MWKDFKAFIMQGNVFNLAVAFIIGAAFKSIVTSLVNDIIMPTVGAATGDIDFKDLAYILKPSTETTDAITLNYGSFIQTVTDFLIIGFSLFIVVKSYERLQKKKEKEPKKPSEQVIILTEIRDLLKKKK